MRCFTLERSSLTIPSYPIDSLDRKVGGQPELLPNNGLSKCLNSDAIRQLWVNNLVDVVTRIRKRLQSCGNLGKLFRRRLEFELTVKIVFIILVYSL